MAANAKTNNVPGDRVAVVAGLRTPFARQLTAYREMNAIELGTMVTTELLARLDIDPKLIERVVYGQVGLIPEAPNIAREVVLASGMDYATDAYSVSRACATSFQSTADIFHAILLGDIEIGLAGGADSASVLPIQVSKRLGRALIHSTKAKSTGEKLRLFKDIKLTDLAPVAPAVKDYSTNLSMGDIAEQMAKNHNVSRALAPARAPGLGGRQARARGHARVRAARPGAYSPRQQRACRLQHRAAYATQTCVR
jgi:acetyl-CoA acyltransferase